MASAVGGFLGVARPIGDVALQPSLTAFFMAAGLDLEERARRLVKSRRRVATSTERGILTELALSLERLRSTRRSFRRQFSSLQRERSGVATRLRRTLLYEPRIYDVRGAGRDRIHRRLGELQTEERRLLQAYEDAVSQLQRALAEHLADWDALGGGDDGRASAA